MSAVEPETDEWLDAGSADALRSAGKLRIEVAGRPILLLWFEDRPIAMDDTCIHRERSLSEGVLLGRRIVCPGHQWAFDVESGHCAARDRCQPVHTVRTVGDRLEVALTDRPPLEE